MAFSQIIAEDDGFSLTGGGCVQQTDRDRQTDREADR
jgi:hypothetical protein